MATPRIPKNVGTPSRSPKSKSLPFTGAPGRSPVKAGGGPGKAPKGVVKAGTAPIKGVKRITSIAQKAAGGIQKAKNSAQSSIQQKGAAGAAGAAGKALAGKAARGAKKVVKGGAKLAAKAAKKAAKEGTKLLIRSGPLGWIVLAAIVFLLLVILLIIIFISIETFNDIKNDIADSADVVSETENEMEVSQALLADISDSYDISGSSREAFIEYDTNFNEGIRGGVIGESVNHRGDSRSDYEYIPTPKVAGDEVRLVLLDDQDTPVGSDTFSTNAVLRDLIPGEGLRQVVSWMLPQWAAPFPVLVAGEQVGDYDSDTGTLSCEWPTDLEWVGEPPTIEPDDDTTTSTSVLDADDASGSVMIEATWREPGQHICHLIAAAGIMFDRWGEAFGTEQAYETSDSAPTDLVLRAARASEWFKQSNQASAARERLTHSTAEHLFSWLSFAYAVAAPDAEISTPQTDCGLIRNSAVQWRRLAGFAYDPEMFPPTPQHGENAQYGSPIDGRLLLLYPCNQLPEAVIAAEVAGLWHPIAFLERNTADGSYQNTPADLPAEAQPDCGALVSGLHSQVASGLTEVCDKVIASGAPYISAGTNFEVSYTGLREGVVTGITGEGWTARPPRDEDDLANAWTEFLCLFGFADQTELANCADPDASPATEQERPEAPNQLIAGSWSQNQSVSWCSTHTLFVDGIGMLHNPDSDSTPAALEEQTRLSNRRRSEARGSRRAANAFNPDSIYNEIIRNEVFELLAAENARIETERQARINALDEALEKELAELNALIKEQAQSFSAVSAIGVQQNEARERHEAGVKDAEQAAARESAAQHSALFNEVSAKYAPQRAQANAAIQEMRIAASMVVDVTEFDYERGVWQHTSYTENRWEYDCAYDAPAEAYASAAETTFADVSETPPGNPVAVLITNGGRGRGVATRADFERGTQPSRAEDVLRFASVFGLLPSLTGDSTLPAFGRGWSTPDCSVSNWQQSRCSLAGTYNENTSSTGRGFVLPRAWTSSRYPLRCPALEIGGKPFTEYLDDLARDWETSDLESYGRFGGFHPCLLPAIAALDWLAEAVGFRDHISGWGFRSFADSDRLKAAAGAGGAPVAAGGLSRHNYGLALDFAWRPPSGWKSFNSGDSANSDTANTGDSTDNTDTDLGDASVDDLLALAGGATEQPVVTPDSGGMRTCGLEDGSYYRFVLPSEDPDGYDKHLDQHWCWRFLVFATSVAPELIPLKQLPSEIWHWSLDGR